MPTAIYCDDLDDQVDIADDEESNLPDDKAVAVDAVHESPAPSATAKKSPAKLPFVSPKPKESTTTTTANHNNKKKASNKRKATATGKPSKGQMTLGAFFGAAATKPPAPPKTPVISAEKKAELKNVVLGKHFASTIDNKKPKPRRVSPTESDRKANPEWDLESRENNDDDHDDMDVESSGVDTPLAKDTKAVVGDAPETSSGTGTMHTTAMETDDDPSVIDLQSEEEVTVDGNDAMDKFSGMDSPLRVSDTTQADGREENSDAAKESKQDGGDEQATAMPNASLESNDDDPDEEMVVEETQGTLAPEKDGKSSAAESIDAYSENVSASVSTGKGEETSAKVSPASPCKSTAVDKQTDVSGDGDVATTMKSADAPSQIVQTTPDSVGESTDKPIETTDNKDAQLVQLQNSYDTYFPQAVELFAACREGLVNSVPALDRKLPDGAPSSEQEAKTRLATLIEGRSESLSSLAADVAPLLLGGHFASVEVVTEEIKLLAKRQALVKDYVPTVLAGTPKPKTSPNIFEDESPDRFWQWQVTVVDLMPNKAAVKQRRGKIRKEVQYLHNLVTVLQTLNQALQANMGDRKGLIDKLSRQEEKVLQYQREQARVALEKQLKEAQRLEKERAKQAKKEAEAAKKKEAAEAKAAAKTEAANAKKEAAAAAAAAKKETKAKEAEAKAKALEEKEQKKQAQLHRQKNAMMSFLRKAAPAPKKTEAVVETPVAPAPQVAKEESSDFDVESFRSEINSCSHEAVVTFGSPSESARSSRRRKSRSVKLSVYVTVTPDNVWDARPYAELQEVTVRNRNKFLSFHEDVRPPYHGTWSKKSLFVSPRNPFKRDRTVFDYDYDSEAEWEEGDNEAGEDIENAADDEEEKDEMEEGDDDGWLAADDDFDDDADEETKLLRQKVVRQDDKALERLQCYIAPVNGQPISLFKDSSPHVKGFSFEEAHQLLVAHTETTASEVELYLDPFPPDLIDDIAEPSSPNNQDKKIAEMQAFLSFVHYNSIGSKEKLVDELRSKHPDVMSSRAEALRTLETVADKQKHPIKGFIWEVKKEILEQYDMVELLEGSSQNDPESAKKQILRTIASHIHNSTHTSKEKLVDDLQANHGSLLASRAETLRHVDALAEKKKRSSGGVYWEVKPTAQRDLGLELLAAEDSPDKLSEKRPSDDLECPSSAKKLKLDQEGVKEG